MPRIRPIEGKVDVLHTQRLPKFDVCGEGPADPEASKFPCNTEGFYLDSTTISSLDYDLEGTEEAESRIDEQLKCLASAIQNASVTEESFDDFNLPNSASSTRELCPECLHLDGEYVALGVLRLRKGQDGNGNVLYRLHNGEIFQHSMLLVARCHAWIRLQMIPRSECSAEMADDHVLLVRVFVLPEDTFRVHRPNDKHMRKVLKYLLNHIDTQTVVWNGLASAPSAATTYADTAESDEESLFYIFNTLSSPSTTEDNFHGNYHSTNSLSDIVEDNIVGLQTELYPYQKRSIAAMLQREVNPVKSPDPRKPQYLDLVGKPFYMDIHEGIVLRQPHLYAEPSGGILSETMGYGKTLICLALILATRGHYPYVPEGRLESSDRRRDREKTGSLLSMAARALKYHGIPWKAEFSAAKKAGYHYDRCLEEIGQHHKAFAQPVFNPTPERVRKITRNATKTIRLVYTTLVIVPPNLLVQWQHEIEKHVEADSLDVLVLDAKTKNIPRAEEMAEYDVILITKARFEQEYRDDDLNIGRRQVNEEQYQSPLKDLCFLRVICDEGHSFAGSGARTHAIALLDQMHIERRWVVSGTPSSTLRGVEVGLSADQADEDGVSRRESLSTALAHRRVSAAVEQEMKDMDRLRSIVVNFLKVQPWANQKQDRANWKAYLTPFDAAGRRRKAPGLRDLLQSLIVRHRIEDIDSDLTLPPLVNRTVYLDPSYYDKLSMNLFLMMLASNFVSSERTDEDYMFHPKNRRVLDQLIGNLRQSSFHWVGWTVHDVEASLKISNEYFDKNIDDISDKDGVLLSQAVMTGERALADAGWKAFSAVHEIGVYISDFPDHAAEAFSLHGQSSEPLLVGTLQAREAQQHIWKHLTEADPGAGLPGAGLRAMHAARERAKDDVEQTNRSSSKTPVKEEPQIRRQTSPLRPKERSSPTTPTKRPHPNNTPVQLPANLTKAQILGFSSAKVTYLIDQVLLHSPTEKIIIFYDANNIAFWIAECLELLSIKFLIYASTLSVARRATYLATFNTSPTFRVLLMDLKQAAHGLHVASASRVYIVSPIWQPNIESQAIKRAHRIGQTKTVHVETLVLRGTLEEEMLKRRKVMSAAEHHRSEKSLLDDKAMAEIIKDIRFLSFEDEDGGREMVEVDKVARLEVPRPLFTVGDVNGDEVDGEGEGLVMARGDTPMRPTKRRKKKTVKTTNDLDGTPDLNGWRVN